MIVVHRVSVRIWVFPPKKLIVQVVFFAQTNYLLLKGKNMKIEDITLSEIRNAFSKCKTKKEVIEFFGYKDNGNGRRFFKKLENILGDEAEDYFVCTNEENYNSAPKKCLYCGSVLPYKKRYNLFCSSSCAASYNNLKRGPHSEETKLKISNSVRANLGLSEFNDVEEYKELHENHCLYCGKETKRKEFCSNVCKNKYLVERFVNGENFVRGVSQVPRFVRDYLFEKHNNCCECCGWGKKNEFSNTVPLEIHHIDGDCTNNRIDNLQLLCPNCHSLTNTNGSLNKNSKRFHRKKKTLKDDING